MYDKYDEIISYLKALALKTLNDCYFIKDVTYNAISGQAKLLLPSGDEKYLSFWVRDCAMMAESGLVPNDLLKLYIEIIVGNGQNSEQTQYLENGLCVPPYAVADHINYNGKPVFFPGTYNDGYNQGDGTFGYYPPFCDNYYFIMLVDQYIRQSKDESILSLQYNDKTLLNLMELSFKGYNVDAKTELCQSDEYMYTVDWGFADTVKKSGLLAMSSLLRYRCARILEKYVLDENRKLYAKKAEKIKKSIQDVLYDKRSGWLYSATGLCHQHDVWATAYAVCLGILQEEKTYHALKNGYEIKTTVKNGYIRTIPCGEDYNEQTSWQCCGVRKNFYQNGAYWATATGWYTKALYSYDQNIALSILKDFIEHTEKYKDVGAPFEWINEETTEYSGLHYGTSGVLPYLALQLRNEDNILRRGNRN